MKRFSLIFSFLLTLCLSANSQAVNNSIKMAYNFTTVAQTVVFNTAMQGGGTLTLSASIADGGGRNPGDPITLKLVFYNSSNAVVSTVQQAYTMTLGAAAATYSVSTNNCGSSCSTVAYVSVQFYGKDGGYWAGNYGPLITAPSLTFDGGSNILYNPEFGTYNGSGFAQGWTSSAGWQNCALYSGSATCVIDNGAQVNGGNYSATGGTTSGPAGGQTTTVQEPTLCCGASSASFAIDSNQQARINEFTNRTTNDSKVIIEQIGNFNVITVEQTGTKNNYVNYYGSGSNNNIDIKQKGLNNTQSNYLEASVIGNANAVTIKQQTSGETTSFNKSAFVTVSGNSNSLILEQKNSGSQYAEVNISGGNKNVDVTQQGSGNHYAKVGLSGNPVDLSLTQSGSTQQYYSINYNCTTSGGCAKITVTQGQ